MAGKVPQFERRKGRHRCPGCGGVVVMWPAGSQVCFECVVRHSPPVEPAPMHLEADRGGSVDQWGRWFEQQLREAPNAGE